MTPQMATVLTGVNVVVDTQGCWTAPERSLTEKGYLVLRVGERYRDARGVPRRRGVRAHRFIYEQWNGPIPQGKQLDHLCRNRACINPDHLEAVTSRENTMRGQNHVARQATATHCKRGHEFTARNTILRFRGRVHRECRECKRERRRVLKARRRLLIAPAATSGGVR